MPEFEYFEPESLEEAINQLAKNNSCTIIAGGTDLVVALKQRLQNSRYLISLDKIPSLKKITKKDDAVIIGAMSTLDDIINYTLIKEKFPALRKAAWDVGSPLLRSIATIGGNICLNTRCRFYNQSLFWRSSREECFKVGGNICHVAKKKNSCVSTFSADIPPVLISYGARVKLVGANEERVIPLENFYSGDGRFPNVILSGSKEILTEIEIPIPQNNLKSCYHKYRMRESIDFPLIGVSVAIQFNEEKRCGDARIIITGAGTGPVEPAQVRGMLLNKKLNANLISDAAEAAVTEIYPFKTTLISPRYKREVAKIIISEAIREVGGI
ncbi:MAG: FAD binding domain-containing protein [Bacillota bacterium]|nr:FAD binding domain-containing protein [Bacillota bacterium]